MQKASQLLALIAVLAAPPALAREPSQNRAWIGGGTGILTGSVDVPCPGSSSSDDCGESGIFQTYSGNVTFSGSSGAAFRARLVRAEEDHTAHHPYEAAALIGSRFGRSNWYGLIGAGRIFHPDDDYDHPVTGFAWEIVFAPSAQGPVGFELSFLGNAGEHVDYVGFNVGMRVGALD